MTVHKLDVRIRKAEIQWEDTEQAAEPIFCMDSPCTYVCIAVISVVDFQFVQEERVIG